MRKSDNILYQITI